MLPSQSLLAPNMLMLGELRQGTEERAEARHLPTSVSMPAPSMCVGDIPIEEFHGELLHYSRPASLQSQATSPNETPLRCKSAQVIDPNVNASP